MSPLPGGRQHCVILCGMRVTVAVRQVAFAFNFTRKVSNRLHSKDCRHNAYFWTVLYFIQLHKIWHLCSVHTVALDVDFNLQNSLMMITKGFMFM